jgi:hypothetical protein
MPDGITFNDVPVLLDVDDAVREFFEQRWPASAWPFAYGKTDRQALAYPFFQKSRAGIFASPYPECPAPRINELVIPSNAGRYAKALVVLDHESIKDLSVLTDDLIGGEWWHGEKFTFKYEYQGNVAGNLQRILWTMYPLTPIRCDATISANLWMLPLVDERYFWNQKEADPAIFESVETWEDLIQNIATALGFDSFTIVGDIAEAYGVPDKECLREANVSMGSMLDTIALSIGKRFFYSGFGLFGTRSGIFYPADFGTPQAIANTLNARIIHGGKQMTTDIADPVVAIARKAYDYWGNADELHINMPQGERYSASTIRCAWWLEHFTDDYSGLPSVDAASQDAFDAFRIQLDTDLEEWGNRPFALTIEGIYSTFNSGHVDYYSYSCERLRTGNMSMTTKLVGLPAGFAPYVNIAQRPGRYIHPHEIARFEVTEDGDGLRKFAKIIKADSPYKNGNVAPISILTLDGTAEEGDVLTCHYEHGIGWRELAATSESTLMKFRALAPINDRTVRVQVIHGGGLTPGHQMAVYDPNNLWSSITKDCIGFARYRGEFKQPTCNSSAVYEIGLNIGASQWRLVTPCPPGCNTPPAPAIPNPVPTARTTHTTTCTVKVVNDTPGWEIVTCSLPANEIRVEIEDTMLARTYLPGELRGMTTESYALRSTYPNVMRPPRCEASCTYTWDRYANKWNVSGQCPNGCACGPAPALPPTQEQLDAPLPITVLVPCVSNSPRIEILFENPHKIDAMCGAHVILRRINNATWGDTIEAAPAGGSASDFRWEAVFADKRKARMISFYYEKDVDNPAVNEWWNGDDPSECDEPLSIKYPLGEPCNGSLVIADYDPNTDDYIARDTESSMMGEPQTDSFVTQIANDECGVNVSRVSVRAFYIIDSNGVCERNETSNPVSLGTATPVIVAMSSEECGKINYAYQNIRAWICQNLIEFADFDINFDGVQFVTAASFGPPSCSGEATYRIGLNVGLSTWELVTPCESGCESSPPPLPSPIPTPETFETVPCSSAANRQCGLNLQMGTICADTGSGAPLPTIVHVPLPLEPVKVVTEVYDNAIDAIIIEQKTIYVCNWEEYPDDQIAIGPCDGSSSGASPASCNGSSVYGWSVSTQSWFLVRNCASGCQPASPPSEPPSNPSEYAEVQVPCLEGEI